MDQICQLHELCALVGVLDGLDTFHIFSRESLLINVVGREERMALGCEAAEAVKIRTALSNIWMADDG